MSTTMRKVMSFEIGDESMSENYVRYTIHVDLRKVIATVLGLAILCIVLTLAFGHNKKSVALYQPSSLNLQPNEPSWKRIDSKFDFLKQQNLKQNSPYTTFASKSKSTSAENESRQKFIKNMAIEAWNAYKQNAWGKDNLAPYSNNSYRIYAPLVGAGGLTLIKSMSTLWTMGLKTEFEHGKQWIARKFDFANSDAHSYVFVAATEYMGSLLSCYALTKDDIFLKKAREVAKALEPAFNTKTGVPNKRINPASGHHTQSSDVHLGEAGGEHLEFLYLAHLTNDSELQRKIENVRRHLLAMNKPNDLYMSDLLTDQSEWNSQASSLFWPSSTFYQYLVKSYIQSNYQDPLAMQMFRNAIDAVDKMKLFIKSKSNHTYARSYDNRYNSYSNSMPYDGCALGAMFALAAKAIENTVIGSASLNVTSRITEMSRVSHYWKLAEELTETCHYEANRTATRLPPENMYIDTKDAHFGSGGYSLHGELAESYFVLWRLTHDEKYREYAWQFTQAIYKNCRTNTGGYTRIFDVRANDSHSDHQPSHFLSTTLKYLYLTFSNDTLLPLDQWVFNRVGQPLPVCGKSC